MKFVTVLLEHMKKPSFNYSKESIKGTATYLSNIYPMRIIIMEVTRVARQPKKTKLIANISVVKMYKRATSE